MAFKRQKTGIKELDKMLNGGIPERSSIVITGGLGTGKTALTMQLLYNAAKNGDRCLFVSLEESPQDIIDQSTSFGWNVGDLVKKNMIIIQHHVQLDYDSLEVSIENTLRKYKDIKFVAVDPISMLKIYFKSETGFRIALFRLSQLFKKHNTTAFLVEDETESTASRFVSDGVIMLKIEKKETGKVRTLEVPKMRKTAHEIEPVTFKITDKGIQLFL
ncbi:MAG: ATPase domain-containing protein [archaeon]